MIPCFQPDEEIADRYAAMRRHTRMLFSLLRPAAFEVRPIPLRHPIRFYEGHLAAFNINQLLQARLIPYDPEPAFSNLFARGIDPENLTAAAGVAILDWPDRTLVGDYIQEADRLVTAAMAGARRPDVLLTCIEHEEMHQETLLALIQQLPEHLKARPEGSVQERAEYLPATTWRSIPAGEVSLGAPAELPFGWDNEYPQHKHEVAAFSIASHKTTNAEFLEFVNAGGYEEMKWWSARGYAEIPGAGHRAPPLWLHADSTQQVPPAGDRGREARTLARGRAWYQRGLFETIPLPLSWPVVVSYHEAEAYARWKGGRLPTEAEYQRAAFPEGVLEEADRRNLANANPWSFQSVGRPNVIPNRLGVYEMVGNGWEWTSSVFAGFSGFYPMPHYAGYSADFFDGRHRVLKGAAPVTPRAHNRPSFRNWYREGYRYAFTTFRLVK
jgi:ergothioneine biosynthesis protein EgtB